MLYYFFLNESLPDIVDIKPSNMEELTEVITAAEFHPHECNLFVYSSSTVSYTHLDVYKRQQLTYTMISS